MTGRQSRFSRGLYFLGCWFFRPASVFNCTICLDFLYSGVLDNNFPKLETILLVYRNLTAEWRVAWIALVFALLARCFW